MKFFAFSAACAGFVALGLPAAARIDCQTKAFASHVEDSTFTCAEVQSATVTGFASDITLRSVVDGKDAGAAEAEASAFAAVQEALARMAKLESDTPLKLRDVTVVLLGHAAKNAGDTAKGRVLGIATQYEGDCILQLYPARIAEQGADSLGMLQFTAAHELFHCVQFATWPELMAEYASHNWWVEGTAETVAQAVFPNVDAAFTEGHNFANHFRDTALTRLTYDNLVFFSWVWAQDPKLVYRIISAMPVGGDEAAQQTALLTVVPAADLSRFVRDFLDNKVVTPGGADPMFGEIPLQMDTNIGAVSFDTDGTRDLEAAPFTMFAVDASFSGGAYQIDVTNQGPVLAQHREVSGTDWTGGPIAADGDCTTTLSYRLAGMATGPAKVRVAATKDTKGVDCKSCGAKAVRDQCLVGTWLIDNVVQGMSIAEYVGNGRPVGTVVVGKNAVKFAENGDSVWGYQNFLVAVQDSVEDSPVAGAVLNGTIDQGWAAGNGRLNTCYVSSDATIKLATEGGNIGDTIPIASLAELQPLEQYSYECSDDGTLILEKQSFLMKLRRLD